MQAPKVEQKTAISSDGTRIGYQVCGEGPAVVLANGLGGTYSTWRHQYALFGREYRMISWDYRGLFSSGRPPSLDALSIQHQVTDLEAVLRAEGVDRALFCGWSMGVQFNFEYFRNHSEQFVGLVVLNGVAGRPFETALGIPGVAHLVPLLAEAMKLTAPLIGPATGLGALAPGAILRLFKLSGMAAPGLDPDVFVDLLGEYAGLDFVAYGETLRHLGAHDAEDVLPQINVPTLIVTGSRDFMTPVDTARQMAETISDARLMVLKGGTHYTAVEFADQVNAEIRALVEGLGYGALGA